MKPEELVQAGRLDEALAELQTAVKAKPADSKLRVFLFQLLCVLGRWDRAMTQLNVAADMDPSTLLMAQVCRPALNSEALRAEIFAGRRMPLVMGQPDEWVGLLLQSANLAGLGRYAEAEQIRDQAFESAPTVSGMIETAAADAPSAAFEWIADADTRLGPMLEAIIDGRYYWVPYTRIKEIRIEEPKDLRDVVWAPANILWTNGGHAVALIPTRYPGSEASPDPAIRLARKTEWDDRGHGSYFGLGQRTFATDAGEYSILQVRRVVLNNAMTAAPPAPAGDSTSLHLKSGDPRSLGGGAGG
ncbi:MAG: type VI secretion system accessory protein TagJ [Phycisphaerales bacterium]